MVWWIDKTQTQRRGCLDVRRVRGTKEQVGPLSGSFDPNKSIVLRPLMNYSLFLKPKRW